LSHAYIFAGPSGVGKFLFARTLAKVLMCENKKAVDGAAQPDEQTDWTQKGCDACRACKWIDKNCHPNLKITEVEKGSQKIGIEAVIDIEKELMLMPFSRTRRVFITNEAERMSEEAFNAFLKTLEEPVKDTVIILVTSNPALLPQTIVSRCQLIRFYAIEHSLAAKYLEQRLKIKHEDALFLSHLADGSIGNACKLQEQSLMPQRKELIKTLLRQDSDRLSKDIIAYARKNSDDNEGLRREIIWQLKIIGLFIRDALWLNYAIPDNQLINKDVIPEAKQYQKRLNSRQMERLMDRLLKSERYIRLNANYTLVVESLFATVNIT
jgi:DNA polymerase-3 subunit delta'